MDDLERSKFPKDIATVKANFPGLGPSSRIIRRRQLFGRGSQRPNLIPRIDSASIYVAGLIGLCSAVTVAYWATVARGRKQGNWEPLQFIERNFVCSVDNFKSGRWWIVLTCSFAHFQPLHLIANMWALWDIGRQFVWIFGAPAFVGTWFVSAITGSLGSLYWERHKNSDNMPTMGGSLGSSAAILGLMFAQHTFMPSTPPRVPLIPRAIPAWSFCAFLVGASVYCLYSGSLPIIGHAGHLGGMAGGVATYFLFLRRIFRR